MGWLYRWSSLLRGYDLSLGYNRVIVLLSAVAGALGLALSVPSEASVSYTHLTLPTSDLV